MPNVILNMSKDKDSNSNFPAIIWVPFEDDCIGLRTSTGIIVIYTIEGILVLAGCQYLPKKEHSL